VCATLIADVRNFTIKRLSLKRKIPFRGSDKATSDGDQPPSTSLQNEPPFPRPIKVDTQLSMEPLEEVITSEEVMELDVTLTDAIERILNRSSAQPSRTTSPSRLSHSRSVSNSTTSTVNTNMAQSFKPGSVRDTLPSSISHESRKLVVIALEDVVKSVNEDLNGTAKGRIIERQEKETEVGLSRTRHEENALREGVKKWLLSVENTEVW